MHNSLHRGKDNECRCCSSPTSTPWPFVGIMIPTPTPGTWPGKLLISLERGGCYQKGCCYTVRLAGSRKVNETLLFFLLQATLCALIQEKEFHTMVSTTELQKTTGTVSQILSTGLWVELSGRTRAKQVEGSLSLPDTHLSCGQTVTIFSSHI